MFNILKILKPIFFAFIFVLAVAISYAQIPTDDLIGKYSFSGNANNEMGPNAHGVVNGAILTYDRCNMPNSAYYFTNTSDYISISDFKYFQNDEISISLWAKADYLTSNCMLMMAPDNWNDRCVLCAQYVGSPSFIVFDYGNCATNGRTIVNGLTFSNLWHHYVFITSSSQNIKKIYMDGVCISSQSFMGTLINYNRDLYIGGGTDWSGGGIGFKGTIDDIRIYARYLDNLEVLSLYYEDACNSNSYSLPHENNVEVYPNPTSDYINIKINNFSEQVNFFLYDFSGRLIINTFFDNTNSINVSTVNNGLYFYRLVFPNGKSISNKIVIKHGKN